MSLKKFIIHIFLAVPLIAELKKIDDKHLIVEVQLEESKLWYHLSNLAKARSALTSARTTANSMYIPPKMQVTFKKKNFFIKFRPLLTCNLEFYMPLMSATLKPLFLIFTRLLRATIRLVRLAKLFALLNICY